MRCSATFILLPDAIAAVGIMLLLPDGRAALEFVDDVLARVECRASVRGCDDDRNGHVADAQIAHAVDDGDLASAEALPRLARNALEFCDGHGFMGLIGKLRDGTIVVRTFAHD